MRSIRIKYTLLTVCSIIVALSIATFIGVKSIQKLGNDDADQMLSLMCKTGAMNLESYFTGVEHSAQTVASLVQNSLEDMPLDQLGNQVENARGFFGEVAYHTNGVLTYYFFKIYKIPIVRGPQCVETMLSAKVSLIDSTGTIFLSSSQK